MPYVIALTEDALAYARGGAVYSKGPRVRVKVGNDRLGQQVAIHVEENHSEAARMKRIAPKRGPPYVTAELMSAKQVALGPRVLTFCPLSAAGLAFRLRSSFFALLTLRRG